MFLTEKTKTDVLHLLVRTHISFLTCQQSCMLLVIIDQICRKCSRSIWMKVYVRGPGRCSNLVKNMLTRFFEGPTPGKIKLTPFDKFRSSGEEEARPGGDIMNKRRRKSPANHIDWISLVYCNIMHCVYF